MPRKNLLPLCLFLALSLLSACGLWDYYFLPPPEDTPQELFEAAMDAMDEKDYGAAQGYFEKLKDNFPFSPYAVQAELGLGDAYFLDDKYLEAVEAYKEFEALHPSHEMIPDVLFQIGLSSYKLRKTIDRRQEEIIEALEYFYRVEESYPDTKYAAEAKKYIVMCRRHLAEHEVYVADLYWRMEKYGSAASRYREIVENFSDIPDIQKYARRRAEYSYYEYQKTLSEDERVRVHGSWTKWLKDWL